MGQKSIKTKKIVSLLVIFTLMLTTLSPIGLANGTTTISVESTTALIGDTVTIAIELNEIPSDWGSMDLKLTYDSSALTIEEINNGDVMFALFEPNTDIENTIILNGVTPITIGQGTKLFDLVFKVKEDAPLGKTDIIIDAESLHLVKNSDFTDMPVDIVDGGITVSIDVSTVIEMVNNATTAEQVQDIIETYSNELGLDMTDYNTLTTTRKLVVAKSILDSKGTGYQGTSGLLNIFNDSVSEQKAEQIAEIELNNAITAAINAIDALPSVDQIIIADKTAVEDTRVLVEAALALGASESDITDLEKLEALEAKIAELELAEQELTAAIEAAIAAIDGLPSVDELTLEDKAAVEAARGLVEAAIALGASEGDIPNLVKLQELEAMIPELELAEQELLAAIEAAIAAIETLPTVDEITLADKTDVEYARGLAEAAIALGASEEDITNIQKLEELEAKIVELELAEQNLSEAIEAAIAAIDGLPSVNELILDDKSAVESARTKVTAAINLGASEEDITNLEKLEELEAKMAELVLIDEAITEAVDAIEELPTLADFILANEQAVVEARALVDEALALGASEVDITNLSKLEELELRIEEIKAKILEAETAIDALPALVDITLEDKLIVIPVRQIVNEALELGASESDVTNIDILEAIENKILDLEEELQNAIDDAISAIAALPQEITENDEALVIEARRLVEVAISLGASEEDITNLDKLIAAEIFLENGYLIGTINIPFENYNVNNAQVTIKLDGKIIAQPILSFENGTITITGETVKIPTIDEIENPELVVIIDGFVYKGILSGTIKVVDEEEIGYAPLNIGTIDLLAGDVNADGNIDILDIAELAKLFNEENIENRAYDLNGDKVINVKDLFFIGKNFGY